MKRTRAMTGMAIGAVVLSLAATALAQKPIIYPAKNQSASQQAKDDAECLAWAKQSTGVDPATAAPPPPQRGGAVKGAAVGAALGSITGEAGRGAGAGA